MSSELKSLLPASLRATLRKLRVRSRGALGRFARNPGFEAYATFLGTRNRRQFQHDKNRGAAAVQEQLAPFASTNMPKIIWMFWQQGEDQAPFVVRRCIDSWRRHNPDWELRVLDDTTLPDYVDMSDFPHHLGLAARFNANLLRLRLLSRYGGVWADATVYCHRPLTEWYRLQMVSGFFAFRHPGPGRWIESWFLMSEQDHILPRAWEES